MITLWYQEVNIWTLKMMEWFVVCLSTPTHDSKSNVVISLWLCDSNVYVDHCQYGIYKKVAVQCLVLFPLWSRLVGSSIIQAYLSFFLLFIDEISPTNILSSCREGFPNGAKHSNDHKMPLRSCPIDKIGQATLRITTELLFLNKHHL